MAKPTPRKQRTRKSQSKARGPDYEALYRLLAESATEVVCRLSPDLTFLYASPASEPTLGRRPDDLIGRRLDDLVHPDDLAGLVTAVALARESEEPATAVSRLQRGDGSWIWCESIHRGMHSPGSTSAREIHSSLRDVSEYKQIEKAIERVAKEWRTTFDSAQDAIVMLNRDREVTRTNLAATRLLDLGFAEILARPLD